MFFQLFIRRALTLTSATIILTGCANGPRGAGNQSLGSAGGDPCSVGTSAIVGVGIGAVLGALAGGKGGALKGGAIGGAVAAVACLAINVQSRQTKTAAQVDREYQQQQGALPREPSVVTYQSQLSAGSVQRGQPFHVNSVLELANGSTQQVQSVREELVVFNPDGSPFNVTPASKPFAASTGGRFENSFELQFPNGVSQGIYNLKTQLYVNNKLAATRDLRTQVVWDGERATVTAGI